MLLRQNLLFYIDQRTQGVSVNFAPLSSVLLPSYQSPDARLLSYFAASHLEHTARTPLGPLTPFAIHFNLDRKVF